MTSPPHRSQFQPSSVYKKLRLDIDFSTHNTQDARHHVDVKQGRQGTAAIGNKLEESAAHFGHTTGAEVGSSSGVPYSDQPVNQLSGRPPGIRTLSSPESLVSSETPISIPHDPHDYLFRGNTDSAAYTKRYLSGLDQQLGKLSTVGDISPTMSTWERSPGTSPGNQTHAGKVTTIVFPKDASKQPDWLVEPLHGDWFHRGRVIRLDDKEANGAIRGRVLVIVAVSSSHQPQCVSLCRHQNYTGKEAPAHWLSHSVVYSEEQPEPNDSDLNRAIRLVMEDSKKTTKVAPKVFINYEHTWTLTSNFEGNCVEFQHLGSIADDDLGQFVATYAHVQKGLLDRTIESVKPKPTDGADESARNRR